MTAAVRREHRRRLRGPGRKIGAGHFRVERPAEREIEGLVEAVGVTQIVLAIGNPRQPVLFSGRAIALRCRRLLPSARLTDEAAQNQARRIMVPEGLRQVFELERCLTRGMQPWFGIWRKVLQARSNLVSPLRVLPCAQSTRPKRASMRLRCWGPGFAPSASRRRARGTRHSRFRRNFGGPGNHRLARRQQRRLRVPWRLANANVPSSTPTSGFTSRFPTQHSGLRPVVPFSFFLPRI